MKFFSFICLCCSLMMFCGCNNIYYDNKIFFNIAISSINENSVNLVVSHNATNRDPYYGFIVQGHVNDISKEISNYLSINSALQLEKEVHYQRKSVFNYTSLESDSEYTFIVFGLTSDGTFICEPGLIYFFTCKPKWEATINPNWNICYSGNTIYDDMDCSCIDVYVLEEEEQLYYNVTYTVDFINTFDSIDHLIAYSADEFVTKYRNETNDNSWFINAPLKFKTASFYRYLNEGDYVSYAIGLNIDGNPTGKYAKSEIFHVDRYPFVDGYAFLLGNWKILFDDETYDVTFTENYINSSFKMYGWGNLDDYYITVMFDRNDNSLRIYDQIVSEYVCFNLNDGTIIDGLLRFRGIYIKQNGDKGWKHWDPSLTLAKASIRNDGSYEFKSGFYVIFDDESITYDTGMTFCIGNKYYYANKMFPFIMYKQ